MPLKKYFSGAGEEVMRDMMDRYGPEKGKSVFYGKVNKMKKLMKGKAPKVSKPVGGKNPFFGNSLPFQMGDGGRWISDSRAMAPMSFARKKGK